jgi:hypothetical protein
MTSVRTSHQQKNVQASFQICGFWTRKRVKWSQIKLPWLEIILFLSTKCVI